MKIQQLTENKGSMTKITDPKIKSLIDDCINICKSENFYIDPSLEFFQEDMGWKRYGYFLYPKQRGSVGLISLNTKLFNMPVKEIKSVILHELAHYLKVQDDFNKKTLQWRSELGSGVWKLQYNTKSDKAPHGAEWKRIASILGKASGIDDLSERTANFDIEDEEGKTKKDYYKYFLVCDDCGKKYGHMKKSKAIQHPECFKCGRCGGTLHVEEV